MPQLSLTVRLLLSLLLLWVPLQSFDQWLYDHLFRLRPKGAAESQYVLLRVSDGKLNQLGVTDESELKQASLPPESGNYSLWHQRFYGRLIKKLNISGSRLIVFTGFFDWVAPHAKLFQILAVLSKELVINLSPSVLKLKLTISALCPSKLNNSLPCSTSQIFAE